jgi:hypothetical protein
MIIDKIQWSELNITILGDIKDFLGVYISKESDRCMHVSQPYLIDQIINQTFQSNAKSRSTPAPSSIILHRYQSLLLFKAEFNYKSIIGKLNYLEWGIRSDISYTTHQCAWFTADPKRPHTEAVRWLVYYLIGTRTRGYYIDLSSKQGLEVYVDTDFSGNWDPTMPELDRDTARLRHSYIITYMGALIV